MRVSYNAFIDRKQRRQLFRYWLGDPCLGALNFLGFYLFRCLPTRTVSTIGESLAPAVVSRRFPKVMQRATNNLERLKPGLSPEEKNHCLKTLWQNIGQVYAEFPIVNRIWREGRVTIIDEDRIWQILAQQRPVIFVFPHLGNWEFLGKYFAEKNLPVLIMEKPGRSRFERKLAAKGRKNIGLNTQPAGPRTIPADARAMRKACAQLAESKHLMIAMDGLQQNQVPVPKFGRDLPAHATNIGFAVRLARRYNAVIIPLRCERLPQTRFTLRVSEPIAITDDMSAEQALEDLDERLAGWILDKPEQWFYLHQLRF